MSSIIPDTASGFPAVFFDTTLSEEPDAKATVTEYPVEEGAAIADHVRAENPEITITGLVSMTPTEGVALPIVLDVPHYTRSAFDDPVGALAGAVSEAIGGGNAGPLMVTAIQYNLLPGDPVLAVHEVLEGILNAGVLCTITTSTIEREDMALTGVKMVRETKGGARFTVTAKKVRKVSSATVAAPKPLLPAGMPKANAGSQTPTPIDEATKKSLLKAVADKGLAAIAGGG